jgi:hypothetical protein
MCRVIDEARLEEAAVHRTPFPFIVAPGLLTPAEATALAAEFPTEGFRLDERSAHTAEKRYRSYNLNVVVDDVRDERAWRALSPAWRRFVDALTAPGYRTALGRTLGVPVDDCAMEIRLCRYGPGCWIDPHTDRLDKRLTQTIYFNAGWRAEWGGNLVLLRSPRLADVAARVLPELGTSVVFAPSESSWHAVEPVNGDSSAGRHSLLIHLAARR